MQKQFMGACRDFFGQMDGQTAMQFGKEIQALTFEDKVEIRAGLIQATGWEIPEIPAPVAAH